ncbi:hypothetical protein SAMN02745857_03232 [Andreprevotia lacus DSM 23236]|jgi:predicted metalloprotease|uniref:Neutral zinc metallopeptidase n=1 Tax=Andreprevotia lacus DSM 23236 TaxID=1121001 RepID=A0A1W1XWZ4_9NEIS|nr:neutral zinc metallopeptidase [Andreprevotia lacus]SMC28387.1 hypothetical protein SAMN02745857_03232 [Andreprevotia lacus DSM 23236]
MRWDEMRESSNVDDERGNSSGGGGLIGGGLRLGVGGIVIAVVVGLLMGKSPMQILGFVMQLAGQHQAQAPARSQPAATDNDRSKQFVAHILGDTEDTWQKIFQQSGKQYQPPRLVLFRNGVNSGCGFTSAAVGPFYCPADAKVYLDLSFFDELHRRFGAPGEFAAAYVVAHEVGHHVQNVLGISAKVSKAERQQSKAGANALSVKMELQADCFAGVWGHYAQQRGLLDPNSLDEALKAANSIGDDTLQRNAGRQVTPDAFTHGTSEQRMHWFRVGFEQGQVQACNTFGAAE